MLNGLQTQVSLVYDTFSNNIKSDGYAIEQVDEYKQFGHEIRIGKDNQTCKIHRRISLGWAAFGKVRDTLRNMPICLKKKAYAQYR